MKTTVDAAEVVGDGEADGCAVGVDVLVADVVELEGSTGRWRSAKPTTTIVRTSRPIRPAF